MTTPTRCEHCLGTVLEYNIQHREWSCIHCGWVSYPPPLPWTDDRVRHPNDRTAKSGVVR